MKEEKPSNPNAFPGTEIHGNFNHEGMTLRDYFAAKAMQGCLNAAVNFPNTKQDIESLSEIAYVMADSMLKQREL